MTFNQLVELNYKQLLTIANTITGCREKGHDLMNDAYLHLHKKTLVLKNDNDFVKYYRVCMKNLWLDSFKKKRIALVDCEQVELIDSDDDLVNDLEKFTQSLPLHERYLYELYYEDDMSIRMIAEEVEISPSYIFDMIGDIKEKLKQKWK